MRKILYITGTRADYGLMISVLKAIEEHPNLELELIATGMHLMEEFGMTVKEIKNDGFKILEIDTTYEKDDKESMAVFIGKLVQQLAHEIKKIDPDIILLLGDRGEMLSGAIIGAYLSIPVAHVHGGEVTSTVDEFARHAITKLSHIHFAATEKSAERIMKLGENPAHVFIVGAPGLDTISQIKLIAPNDLVKKYKLDPKKPIILMVQHPLTQEVNESANQIRKTLEAITELTFQTLVVYPNADAGGRKMIEVIKEFEKYPYIKSYKNISHQDYLSLLKIVDVIVGNSSGGIIEAPTFGIPVVNIGSRQDGREQAENVINVQHDKKEIISAIEKAVNDMGFREKIKNCNNPYKRKETGKTIADILNNIKIDESILRKKIMY